MLTQREEELQDDLTHILGAPLASGSRTKGGKGGSGVGSWVIIKIIQDRDEIFMGVLKIDQGLPPAVQWLTLPSKAEGGGSTPGPESEN